MPEDGFCLSAFLVIRSEDRPGWVLLGKPDPSAPWDHLGALDAERVARWKEHWMLPSCHLRFGEGPDEAAARVLAELTGLAPRALEGPIVGSEVYGPPGATPPRRHWDLEFVYTARARADELARHPAWTELAFVDTRSLRAETLARSHSDILALAGVPTG